MTNTRSSINISLIILYADICGRHLTAAMRGAVERLGGTSTGVRRLQGMDKWSRLACLNFFLPIAILSFLIIYVCVDMRPPWLPWVRRPPRSSYASRPCVLDCCPCHYYHHHYHHHHHHHHQHRRRRLRMRMVRKREGEREGRKG